jgi:hypothetical protein
MEARGGGFVSRPGFAGLRSRGGGSQGLFLSPDRRVPRPLPGRSAGPQASQASSSVISGAAGPRPQGGFLPVEAAASCRLKRRHRAAATQRRRATAVSGWRFLVVEPPQFPAISSKKQDFLTIYNGRVAYCSAALYIVP